MKQFIIFSLTAILSLTIFSCKNDQNDYGQMKGINYFSRTDAFSTEQLLFENNTGHATDTLKRGARISVDPSTFTNADGSAYDGKVVLVVKENFVRGWMALNSVPTVSNGNPLYTEGEFYTRAVDLDGNDLLIASGKHLNIEIPGNNIASNYTMFYGEDNVKDPSAANTSLFNWKEASSDIIISTQDPNTLIYYYKLMPTQLGWASCSRVVTNSSPTGIKIRVQGIYPIFASNTAVYIVPKFAKSAFRLWNYDAETNVFSMDQPYLNDGDQAYVIAIASVRHFKIYYAREEITINSNSSGEVVKANEAKLGDIIVNLSTL